MSLLRQISPFAPQNFSTRFCCIEKKKKKEMRGGTHGNICGMICGAFASFPLLAGWAV